MMYGLLILLQALITFLLFFPAPLFAQDAGKVTHRIGDLTANGRDLYDGDTVSEEDLIKTGKDSRAKILMVDESILDLGPETSIKIARYQAKVSARNNISSDKDRDVELLLEQGTLRAHVSKKTNTKTEKFHFKTKWGVMAVRGTEVVVESKESCDIKVLDGTVDFLRGTTSLGQESAGSQESISIDSGKRLSLTSKMIDSPSEPIPQVTSLSENEIVAARKAAVIADTTFMNYVDFSESKQSRQREQTTDARSPVSQKIKLSTADRVANNLQTIDISHSIEISFPKEVVLDSIATLGSASAASNSTSPTGSTVGASGGVGAAGSASSSADSSSANGAATMTIKFNP